MESLLQDLWLRAVIFNQEGNVLIYKNNNQYEFLRSRKAVFFGTALKKQVKQIIKDRFKIVGAEIGGLTFLGRKGTDIFIKVILKKEMEFGGDYLWIEKGDMEFLILDPVTREILQKIFNNKK